MRTWVLVYSTRSRRSPQDDSAELFCELGTLPKTRYAALGLRRQARSHIQLMCHGILFAASVVNDGMPTAEFAHPDRIYYAHVFHLMELMQLCKWTFANSHIVSLPFYDALLDS